jgi:dynein intermediate chain 1
LLEEEAAASSNVNKEEDVIHSAAMGKSLRILERMVNQNAEDEIFQDFKYWEDLSDQFREGEGSLLPLWRFSTERTKRKQVTSIACNPAFSDLFAVGYGSYDFMRQGSGMICCFTLKNTSHPEYSFATESGVMCLHFHPQHHALLAVGCYDGTVMVYDVRNKQNRPIYTSSIKTGKHTDPVWQVIWQEADIAKELNFFSVSSDGRVANWVMSKNSEFKMEAVMNLKLVTSNSDEPDDETSLTGLAGGCCFDFNKQSEHLFIVGTEEGKIHKCSKAYSGQYLETYDCFFLCLFLPAAY